MQNFYIFQVEFNQNRSFSGARQLGGHIGRLLNNFSRSYLIIKKNFRLKWGRIKDCRCLSGIFAVSLGGIGPCLLFWKPIGCKNAI